MSYINEYSVEISSLLLTEEDILNEMGYDKIKPQEDVHALVASMWGEVKNAASPVCAFRLIEGSVSDSNIQLVDNSIFTVGPVLASLLAGSELFALFVATAGDDFQAYQRNLAIRGDVLQCFIADIIGTCLVEAVGAQMERLLEKCITPLKHTNRFSPGYCGWKLTEQKKLFALLGGNPCGIHLSDSCLMMPEKSISGIVGIGHKVNERIYGCRYCELDTCYKRKKKKVNYE